MILAIDTTHDVGSIALVSAVGLVEEVTLRPDDGYSAVLFVAIEDLLGRHGVSFDGLDAIAAARGPGTFTGVRIGLAAAKGLGEAIDKPVFGIGNLDALATFGTAALRVPFYDARRGEVYSLLPGGHEAVLPFEMLLAQLAVDSELVSFTFENHPPGAFAATIAPRAIAAAIGQLALRRYEQGERPDAAILDASYVRSSDAEMNWIGGPG